jgi:nucleoside-diphosphate-sugar epimerase
LPGEDVTWFQGDLGDPAAMAAAAAGCDVAVHAARECAHDARLEVLGWVNVAGTENALKAARHAGCKRFVHVGCVDVTLANHDRVNWNEDKALGHRPKAPHARTELEAEELVIGLGDQRMSTVVLRAATTWGPDDRRLLPRLVSESRAGGVQLVGRGENLVATCHVDNLAAAVLGAARRAGAAGCLFHVTDDEMTLSRDFYGGLCTALGLPAPKLGASVRTASLKARVGLGTLSLTHIIHRGRSTSFDVSPARDLLGYAPHVTVDEGLAQLAEAVATRGGADGVLAQARDTPGPDAIQAQVQRAG